MNPDPSLFSHCLQLGGIRTGTLDDPQPNGRPGCRVALIDTGAGLRYTVAIDRGGDIVDATHHDCPLAYLTPNGLKRPSEAYHFGTAWQRSWAGGLVTTCGPLHIGSPLPDTPHGNNQHGHHDNTPAAVLAVRNPRPRRGELDFSIEMSIADTRMSTPVVEVLRTISGRLGQPAIRIHDEVTNLGPKPVPHHWLYHINLGYPLAQPGARMVMGGAVKETWGKPDRERLKQLSPPMDQNPRTDNGGIILDPAVDDQGICRVGLVNEQRGLALGITFNRGELPRLGQWRCWSPGGAYVCGIEPFFGSLIGPGSEDHQLGSNQTRQYTLDLQVLQGSDPIATLDQHDADITFPD